MYIFYLKNNNNKTMIRAKFIYDLTVRILLRQLNSYIPPLNESNNKYCK